MKRDWDVVRQILLELEEAESPTAGMLGIEGMDDQVFGYHAKLMCDAGLVEAAIQEWFAGGINAQVDRMTWSGQEFLDGIRHKSVWDKIKTNAEEKGVSLTFETIKLLVTSVIKHRLGIDLE